MPVLLSLPEHTTGTANIPTNPQSRGCTGTLMCCALRHRAALTPQPAALVTDVRTYFISEDENQQGNQNDWILSYHFILQMMGFYHTIWFSKCPNWKILFSPVLMSTYFQLLAMDGIHTYPQLPSRCCLQNTRIPRARKYGSKQVTSTKYLCKRDHSCATPLTSQPSRRWSLLSIRLGGLQAGETTPAPAESGGCVPKSCWNTGMGTTQNTPHLCFCLFQKGKINK